MAKYFTSFPYTYQNGVLCRDIIRSVHLTQQAVRSSQLYYEFDLVDGQRPDTISYDYYQTPYYDWMIYHANEITDPYYGWYANQYKFDTLLKQKYGSISKALETIVHYRVNWADDSRRITRAVYQNMSAGQRKYWRPIDTFNDDQYVRKQLDWIRNTNLVAEVGVADPSVFARGDYVNQYDGVDLIASATVAAVGTSSIQVNNVTGAFNTTAGSITCPDTDASSTVTSYAIITRSIPEEEALYWVGVNAYDYENERNESLKTIKLVDKAYAKRIQEDLELKLNPLGE